MSDLLIYLAIFVVGGFVGVWLLFWWLCVQWFQGGKWWS